MGNEYSAFKYERNFPNFNCTFFWSHYMHCFVLLINVHAFDNISSGWLIAINLHLNSIESLLYMLHKWCTVIGAHM